MSSFDCNTILVVGSTSGVGRAMAEKYHKLGKTVIVSGRRTEKLNEVVKAAGERMHGIPVDVRDTKAIEAFAKEINKFPALDCVINCVGIQKTFKLTEGPTNLQMMDEEIDTNFRAAVHLSAHFVPHLLTKPAAYIMHVSSTQAAVPFCTFPIYAATKAALHSFCVSLRWQLKQTSVRVVEIVPPFLQTSLHEGIQLHPAIQLIPVQFFVDTIWGQLEGNEDEVYVAYAEMYYRKMREGLGLFNESWNSILHKPLPTGTRQVGPFVVPIYAPSASTPSNAPTPGPSTVDPPRTPVPPPSASIPPPSNQPTAFATGVLGMIELPSGLKVPNGPTVAPINPAELPSGSLPT